MSRFARPLLYGLTEGQAPVSLPVMVHHTTRGASGQLQTDSKSATIWAADNAGLVSKFNGMVKPGETSVSLITVPPSGYVLTNGLLVSA